MRRIGLVGIAIVLVGCLSQPAWARTRFHDLAESQYYREKAGGMVGRGLLNVFTSFMDVLVNTVNETKAGPPFVGTLTGFGKGIGCGTLRLGSGVVDVVTFWVPGFNGFPVSDSYENCLSQSGSVSAASERILPPTAGEDIWEATAVIEPMPMVEAAPIMPEAIEPILVEPPAPVEKTWKK